MTFEQHAPEANKFLREIANELGIPQDTNAAFRIMKSVLHTLRDVLTPEESLHLIAQLPLGIKGVYVDSWHVPAKTKIRTMEQFLQALREHDEPGAARDFGNDETAQRKTRGVLNVIKRRVTTGEVQHMIDQFPMELAGLWLPQEGDPVEH